MTMSEHDKDKMETRVLETANRLRLIRTDFADDSDQIRREYLCEEIEKALAAVVPAERNEFLRRLLERFPTGDFAVQPGMEGGEVEGMSTADEPRFRNVDFMIQNLLEVIPTLTDEQKAIIDTSLQEAGLRPGPRQDDFIDLDQEGEEGDKALIHISSSLKKESLSFLAKELLFVASDGNYVDFYLQEEDKARRVPIRNSISNIEQQFKDIPYYFRCHRAFIVNMNAVSSSKGNALGYQLSLQNYSHKVPVSRQKIKAFDLLYKQEAH